MICGRGARKLIEMILFPSMHARPLGHTGNYGRIKLFLRPPQNPSKAASATLLGGQPTVIEREFWSNPIHEPGI